MEFVKTSDKVGESAGILQVDVAINGQRSVNVVVKYVSRLLLD